MSTTHHESLKAADRLIDGLGPDSRGGLEDPPKEKSQIDETPQLQQTRKIGKGALCCIGCCLCTVVALAIMIPVGIFVIAPNMAQGILDKTVISSPNMTQAACPTPFSWLMNHVEINVPSIGPVKTDSTILEYNQTVYTTACDVKGTLVPGACCGQNWEDNKELCIAGFQPQNNDTETEFMLGWYNAPEMTVSPGINHKYFEVVLHDNNTVVLFAVVVPLFFYNLPLKMILKAKDVSVKAMGLTIPGLTMHNEMTCVTSRSYISPAPAAPTITMPNTVCHPDNLTVENSMAQAYSIVCGAGDTIPTTPTTTTSTTTTPGLI